VVMHSTAVKTCIPVVAPSMVLYLDAVVVPLFLLVIFSQHVTVVCVCVCVCVTH